MDSIGRFRSARVAFVLGAGLALAGSWIGHTMASIPASGVISACYTTRGGDLRIIDYPAKKCVSGERLIRWNQAGAPATIPLTSLTGTACVVSPGKTARLHAEINPATGVVTLRCDTVLQVTGPVTFTSIVISAPSAALSRECSGAKTCSVNLPLGTPDAVVALRASTDFRYTCPGKGQQGSYPDVSHTIWQGECPVVMTGDLTVATAVAP